MNTEPTEPVNFEVLAENVKTGVDRLISAVRRGNSNRSPAKWEMSPVT